MGLDEGDDVHDSELLVSNGIIKPMRTYSVSYRSGKCGSAELPWSFHAIPLGLGSSNPAAPTAQELRISSLDSGSFQMVKDATTVLKYLQVPYLTLSYPSPQVKGEAISDPPYVSLQHQGTFLYRTQYVPLVLRAERLRV